MKPAECPVLTGNAECGHVNETDRVDEMDGTVGCGHRDELRVRHVRRVVYPDVAPPADRRPGRGCCWVFGTPGQRQHVRAQQVEAAVIDAHVAQPRHDGEAEELFRLDADHFCHGVVLRAKRTHTTVLLTEITHQWLGGGGRDGDKYFNGPPSVNNQYPALCVCFPVCKC